MTMYASIPAHARLPINHCNLPAAILGSQRFQLSPTRLLIDGVLELHKVLFDDLQTITSAELRAVIFDDYMRSCFLLDHPEQAGLKPGQKKYRREKADYLRLLRGWFFNPDGREAAVLKSWVESRFGLLVRNHEGPLEDYHGLNYQHFLADRAEGLYNSNALESQLDLLYSFCQFELQLRHPQDNHYSLYRGTNKLSDYETLDLTARKFPVILLNNLNSFTDNRERADEFGDTVFEASIPLAKILYFPGLLPGVLKGEDEYLVLGGVYSISICEPVF
ncbi:MAG: NAD(+)--dinitrogen-reductase ADP-D-ribosyltransferase [gamma proteobacterium symbiont of Phacoides pectinatus]